MMELKPCPYCGNPIKENRIIPGIYGCEGDTCPGTTVEYMTAEEWNHRPIEDDLQQRIDELEAENERLREAMKSILRYTGECYDVGQFWFIEAIVKEALK